MSEYFGPILIPDNSPSGTFPLRIRFGRVLAVAPTLAIHRFGHGDAAAEQRFILGDGATRYSFPFPDLSLTEKNALQSDYDAHKGTLTPFTVIVTMPDGTTETKICRYDGALAVTQTSATRYSATVAMVEVPQSSPTYSVTNTLTRFPDSTMLTSMLGAAQEMIPLLVLNGNCYASNRRCTVGGQLYQARLADWGDVSQSIDGSADQFTFSLGNADRVISLLSRSVSLYGCQVQFSLFHVNSGTLLNLWSGEVNDFTISSSPVASFNGGDPLWDLRKAYPVLTIDRSKGFDVVDQPVLVHSGGNPISATSLPNDTAYGAPVQDVWVNNTYTPLPVPATMIAGRDESQYYTGLGVVSRGPVSSYYGGTDKPHTLDGQPNHGAGDTDPAKRAYGLRISSGGTPATGDEANADSFAMDSVAGVLPFHPLDSVSWLQIRRTDPSGIQPTTVQSHQMIAQIAQGLGGWVWTAPGTKVWTPSLINPVWIAVNTYLLWKSAQFAGNTPVTVATPSATTLGAGMTATDTTMQLAAGVLCAGMEIRVDSEVMAVTAGSDLLTVSVQRGEFGTTAAAHSSGAAVAILVYSKNRQASYWYHNAAAATLEAYFDCAQAIADAAVCSTAVTPLFARQNTFFVASVLQTAFPIATAYLTGTGVPSSGLGSNGDAYLDTASGFLYTKVMGSWIYTGNYVAPNTGGQTYTNAGGSYAATPITSEPQFACQGVVGGDGNGQARPLRDVLRDILGSCLGGFNFNFGKLRTRLRYNASVTDAFTIGNSLYQSYSESSRKPAFTRLEATFNDVDYSYQANIMGYEDSDVLAVLGKRKATANLFGVTNKSQAARITTIRAREEMGGIGMTDVLNARVHSLKSTVLALSVEPGSVISYTGPETNSATVKFRCTKWVLGKDFSLSVQGTSVTEGMYDLTTGPKPADVAPSAIPDRTGIGINPLNVLPISGAAFTCTATADGTATILTGTYCPPLPVASFVGVTVWVETPSGSGNLNNEGDLKYNGVPTATDSTLLGAFVVRMPAVTAAANWTVYLAPYTSAIHSPLDTVSTPHVTVVAPVYTPVGLAGVGTPVLPTTVVVDQTIEGLSTGADPIGTAVANQQSISYAFNGTLPTDPNRAGLSAIFSVWTDNTFTTMTAGSGRGWFTSGPAAGWGIFATAGAPTASANYQFSGPIQGLGSHLHLAFTVIPFNGAQAYLTMPTMPSRSAAFAVGSWSQATVLTAGANLIGVSGAPFSAAMVGRKYWLNGYEVTVASYTSPTQIGLTATPTSAQVGLSLPDSAILQDEGLITLLEIPKSGAQVSTDTLVAGSFTSQLINKIVGLSIVPVPNLTGGNVAFAVATKLSNATGGNFILIDNGVLTFGSAASSGPIMQLSAVGAILQDQPTAPNFALKIAAAGIKAESTSTGPGSLLTAAGMTIAAAWSGTTPSGAQVAIAPGSLSLLNGTYSSLVMGTSSLDINFGVSVNLEMTSVAITQSVGGNQIQVSTGGAQILTLNSDILIQASGGTSYLRLNAPRIGIYTTTATGHTTLVGQIAIYVNGTLYYVPYYS